MNAIAYLLVKNVKNAALDTIRHPLKLMLYAFIIVSMIYGAVMGFTAGSGEGGSFLEGIIERSGGRLLSGAYLAVLYFISIPIMLKGLSSGTSFFSLSDVINMFVAPISERMILIYGVGRQLATMLILVITFSAYGGMMVNMFHIGLQDTFMLIFGIIIMLIMVQLVTLMIFCLASCHPVRAAVMKYIIYGMAFFAVGVVVIFMFANGINDENFFEAVSLPILEFVPIIGWMHGFVYGIITADTMKILIYGILLIAVVFLSLLTLIKTRLDFYEDVLSQAESYHEFRESIREGKISDKLMMGNREIKLRKLGINRGEGSTAIFFKHLREGGRRSRLMFFNMNTVVLILFSVVVSCGMRLAMPEIEPTIIYLAVTIILAYVQFFFSASGDWVKELTKPYIYLIPDGAVKKLVMAAATGLIKPFTDGIITYVIFGILTGGSFCDIVISALVYGSFGSVYIASNILAQRLVGIESSGGIFITFYMSVIVLTLLPGIIIGLVIMSSLAGVYGYMAATLLGFPVLIWNIIISAVIFFACRNLLNNTE
ncbi:MAG: putative ABC exporter domain-containing protein [Clostridia bacterium]|nr:putative ABC exporter domain-containing protein [Clostridia bacterium]MBR2175814.1 putative ABC exporter domain-containing protein [Clostridia bacterium]